MFDYKDRRSILKYYEPWFMGELEGWGLWCGKWWLSKKVVVYVFRV